MSLRPLPRGPHSTGQPAGRLAHTGWGGGSQRAPDHGLRPPSLPRCGLRGQKQCCWGSCWGKASLSPGMGPPNKHPGFSSRLIYMERGAQGSSAQHPGLD